MNRIAAAILFVALTTACSAGQSRIEIAVQLYNSCLAGFHQAKGWPKTKILALEQTIELDNNCTDWTAVWLTPFLELRFPNENSLLTEREEAQFIVAKNRLAAKYYSELLLNVK